MIDPIHIITALFLASFLLGMAAIAESNACHREKAKLEKAQRLQAEAQRARLTNGGAK